VSGGTNPQNRSGAGRGCCRHPNDDRHLHRRGPCHPQLLRPPLPRIPRLRRELMAKSWKPVTLSFSGVTDCYQPIERKLKLTRRCLEVCAEFRNPVGIITKNALVARDIDLLASLAA